MMYRLVLTVLGACLIAGGIGCEQKQTVALDEPLTPSQPTVREQRSGFFPWEWGNGDREIEEIEIEYAEEEPRQGPLEALAFWNWGDDDEPDPITKSDVLGNMSPELSTLARTPDEIDIQISRTIDTNGRNAWDDVLNVFLLDRPARMSAQTLPIP